MVADAWRFHATPENAVADASLVQQNACGEAGRGKRLDGVARR
jgi:hypothetical protein